MSQSLISNNLKTSRFLSIQSHVVSGYCGNKSATFPLQLLGFEVDVMNTVQLSNHTQYKITRGQIFTSQDLDKIHDGLKENDLLKLYDQIITGYVADVSFVESMASLIRDTKTARESIGMDCFYTIDPVLGDDGVGFYVPNGPAMAEAYKTHLLSLADMMTPNRFEASILSGVEIDQDSDEGFKQALSAINVLHKKTGIQMVVLTSLHLKGAKDKLTCLISHWPEVSERHRFGDNQTTGGSIWSITVQKLDKPFTGTGDLFTALITAWLRKTNFDIQKSLENTVNTIKSILDDTLSFSAKLGCQTAHSHELRLVQNRDEIIQPKVHIKATQITANRAIDGLSTTKVQASNFRTSDKLPLTS